MGRIFLKKHMTIYIFICFILDYKETKPVNTKENQSWIFIGRTDAEAEAPILWPPDAKNWLTGKDFDAGKDWRQEEKGMTEDEMAGWHHWLDGQEFEQDPGVGDGQGRLAYCSPWDRKETWLRDWTELSWASQVALEVKNLPANENVIVAGSITWSRKCKSTPVFLPGKSPG